MFIFLVQLADLVKLHELQLFFVFFVLAWALYFFRLYQSSKYSGIVKIPKPKSVTVIIPVTDEDPSIFTRVLEAMQQALVELDAEVFVIPNGPNSETNALQAEQAGFKVYRVANSSKRDAIARGAQKATKEVVVILDSDTIVTKNSIKTLARGFVSDLIGGITPRQTGLTTENVMERLCDWFEDVRFNNTLKGLSYHSSIHCLPGRLFAIRRDLLVAYLPEFTSQTLFGKRVETGDDRVLTSMLLQDGYETLYEDTALVYTVLPKTLKTFIKQRTRWSRSSFRETLLSLKWLFNYPYTAITLIGDVLIRWLFFAVIVTFLYRIFTGQLNPHYFHLSFTVAVIGCIIGFFVSGFLRQIPHLRRYPHDILLTPLFSLLSAFILTPVEWYGNVTFWVQNWLTRKTK